jgi:hypothetical protein
MKKYIEFKAKKYLGGAEAREIIDWGTVDIVLSVGKIRGPARVLFEAANIEWADDLPEDEIRNHQESYY